MKVTIKTTEPKSREIDWSKKMIVTNGEQFVQTTGEHSGPSFSGMSISNSHLAFDWLKSDFTPCTSPVTITFENEL